MLARVPLSLSPEHSLCRFTALPGNWETQAGLPRTRSHFARDCSCLPTCSYSSPLLLLFDNPLFRAHVIASTNSQPKEVMMHVRSLPGKLSEHFCGGIALCRIAVILCYPGDYRHDRRVVKLS